MLRFTSLLYLREILNAFNENLLKINLRKICNFFIQVAAKVGWNRFSTSMLNKHFHFRKQQILSGVATLIRF